MRLGQLARKYSVKQVEVISFLNEAEPDLAPFHHNSKLSEAMEEIIASRFSLIPNEVVESEELIEEQVDDVTMEVEEQEITVDEIIPDKKTEADLQQELDPTLPSIKPPLEELVDEKIIDTERLLELAEADNEASKELSEITHIKAPKKELSGLKVVGKIELAEPKIKLIDDDVQKNEQKINVNTRAQNHQLIDEKKDITRQKIKEQKERYVARKAKQKLEEEKKKKKAKNKAHYKQKMKQAKAQQVKQKLPVQIVETEKDNQVEVYKPISIFDRFWKLFNL